MQKTFCSKCCGERFYQEETRTINFGFNDKERVLIEGPIHICSTCGSEVDSEKMFLKHLEIAEKMLKDGRAGSTSQKTEKAVESDDTENEKETDLTEESVDEVITDATGQMSLF